jgi:hypothetical protein
MGVTLDRIGLVGCVKEKRNAKSRMISAPHVGWYDFNIPKINTSVVEKELLSIEETTEYFRIEKGTTISLVKEGKLSCYNVRNKDFVRRTELSEALARTT